MFFRIKSRSVPYLADELLFWELDTPLLSGHTDHRRICEFLHKTLDHKKSLLIFQTLVFLICYVTRFYQQNCRTQEMGTSLPALFPGHASGLFSWKVEWSQFHRPVPPGHRDDTSPCNPLWHASPFLRETEDITCVRRIRVSMYFQLDIQKPFYSTLKVCSDGSDEIKSDLCGSLK